MTPIFASVFAKLSGAKGTKSASAATDSKPPHFSAKDHPIYSSSISCSQEKAATISAEKSAPAKTAFPSSFSPQKVRRSIRWSA